MSGLAGAAGLVLVTFGAMLCHYEYENWKARRCDACRIEREQGNSKSTVIRTHACSPRRWPFKRAA